MIDGVKVKVLKLISDNRGRLMEILRRDDELFEEFGQVYITTVNPGIIKAWHYHKSQNDNFCCVNGRILLALYDARFGSSTFGQINDFILSLKEPKLVHIPKDVYHGFKGIGDSEAMVVNTVTRTYSYKDPDEYRVDPFDDKIGYKWDRVD